MFSAGRPCCLSGCCVSLDHALQLLDVSLSVIRLLCQCGQLLCYFSFGNSAQMQVSCCLPAAPAALLGHAALAAGPR